MVFMEITMTSAGSYDSVWPSSKDGKAPAPMPAEIRYIVFSHDEVASAIERYARGTFPGFPAGEVLQVETLGDDVPSGRITIREGARQFSQIDIGAHDLLSFMIRACRDSRVPLPSRAPKKLCFLHSSLALAIMLDARKFRPAPPPPPRPRTAARARVDFSA